MSRITLLAVFFTVATHLNAQEQKFPDGGLENCWRTVTPHPSTLKKPYWDFNKNYFLTTINSLHGLTDEEGIAPLTAFRLTDDVYDGQYSLKLVSGTMIVGDDILFLPGAAGTLEIIIDPDDPNGVGGDCILGEPFTSKPSALTGYYKYAPVNGDSAAVEVQLKRDGNVIGSGKQITKGTVTSWAKFKVPITYTSEETPDTIIIIFSASADYDFTNVKTLMECKGQVNSTLCLDELEFEYDSIHVGVKEMFATAIQLSVFPNPSKENVSLQIAKETNGTVIIYDYLTRKVGEYFINGTQIDIDIQDYATGSYLVNVIENGRVITTKRFVKE
jgi:hypothetical protein